MQSWVLIEGWWRLELHSRLSIDLPVNEENIMIKFGLIGALSCSLSRSQPRQCLATGTMSGTTCVVQSLILARTAYYGGGKPSGRERSAMGLQPGIQPIPSGWGRSLWRWPLPRQCLSPIRITPLGGEVRPPRSGGGSLAQLRLPRQHLVGRLECMTLRSAGSSRRVVGATKRPRSTPGPFKSVKSGRSQ